MAIIFITDKIDFWGFWGLRERKFLPTKIRFRTGLIFAHPNIFFYRRWLKLFSFGTFNKCNGEIQFCSDVLFKKKNHLQLCAKKKSIAHENEHLWGNYFFILFVSISRCGLALDPWFLPFSDYFYNERGFKKPLFIIFTELFNWTKNVEKCQRYLDTLPDST